MPLPRATLNGRTFDLDNIDDRPIWATLEEVLRETFFHMPEDGSDVAELMSSLTRIESEIQDALESYPGKATLRWCSDAGSTGVPWYGRLVLTTTENKILHTIGPAHVVAI